MTTKAEFRDLLRRRLEDTSLTAPLWDDATLDDATAEGLARYGAFVPLEQRAAVSVVDAAKQIDVSGLESGEWIVAVRDPADCLIESAGLADESALQGWRWWAGSIRLTRPATGGTWTVDWRSPRSLPELDAGPMPIREGDETAVSLLAAASALRRRAIEDAKRGGRESETLLALAGDFDRRGERMALARGRRVRSFLATRW